MFSLLNDDVKDIQELPQEVKILYDKDGNMDIEAMLPDYKELADALESGASWYDIMYPNGQVVKKEAEITDDWQPVTLPKKRKAPTSNTPSKRPRYN